MSGCGRAGRLVACPVTWSTTATQPHECGVAFASFKGHESPLRHRAALASCASGGHAIWWTVEAATEADALALLPFFVAERSTVTGSARSRSREPQGGAAHVTPQPGLYARRWQALIVLALSLLVVSVDNTILNVALPTIREELDASSSELQWIVDSYLLVFAGLLLIGRQPSATGSAARRRLFAGLAIFGAGSLLAAISGSSTELIASRALMGVGAAAIMPTTLSILTNIFPKDERPEGDRRSGRPSPGWASRSARSRAAC